MRARLIALQVLLAVSALPTLASAQAAPVPVVVGTPQQEEIVVGPPPAPAPPMVSAPVGMVTFQSAEQPVTVVLMPVGVPMMYPGPPQPTCHTPCAMNVPLGTYTLMATPDGGGPRLTRAVTVTPGRLDLRITPRRSRGTAIGLTAGGGGAAVLGLGFIAAGLEFSLVNAGSTFSFFNPTPFYVIGAIAAGVGVALLIPGVLMLRGGSGGVEERRASTRRLRLLGVGPAPVPGGMVLGSVFTF